MQKPCRICPHITSSSHWENRNHHYHIKDNFNCNSTNIVYLISCILCDTFYIGETLRRLRDRMGDHLRSITKNDKDKPVAKHFNSTGHNITHMEIRGLALNFQQDSNWKKTRTNLDLSHPSTQTTRNQQKRLLKSTKSGQTYDWPTSPVTSRAHCIHVQ